MADNKFDLNKIKDNVGEFVGSLKSMINPATGTVNADPDDALGVKIAQIATMLKQSVEAQQEQVKNLAKINELMIGAFQDIEALRASIKKEKPVEQSAEPEKKE